jgi:hypothetical protein
MIERVDPQLSLTPDPFAQLEARLRAGDENGQGYLFDHYRVPVVGMEVDRLRYAANNFVNVVLRQVTNQSEGLYSPLPFEGRKVSRTPFRTDIIADLMPASPDNPLRIQREDGHRSSTQKASWSFAPLGKMQWNISDPYLEKHGPIDQETIRQHLSWILGPAAMLRVVSVQPSLQPKS